MKNDSNYANVKWIDNNLHSFNIVQKNIYQQRKFVGFFGVRKIDITPQKPTNFHTKEKGKKKIYHQSLTKIFNLMATLLSIFLIMFKWDETVN